MNIRYIFILYALLWCATRTLAQDKSVRASVLASEEVEKLFPSPVKAEHGIRFPIFRVYSYVDESGKHFCVLTESKDAQDSNGDVANNKIQAFLFKAEEAFLKKNGELSDQILGNESEEESIWFWTKYASFDDLDKDGIIDPILVYGTSALNGTDDGRVIITVQHKDVFYHIRHQNGILDDERHTNIDPAFYKLPNSVQEAVKQIIVAISNDNKAIFPHGWEDAMKAKKTIWRE